MAERGKEDLANLDATSIHSDASTEILYLPENSGVPVVDLVTPSISPESSVLFVSPASSIYSDSIDSDDDSSFQLSCASPLYISVEDYAAYQ